jgi:hypothetical protein
VVSGFQTLRVAENVQESQESSQAQDLDFLKET